ncbi:MAG: hypothetical protein E7077_06115 [Bacteroidales bacterium]|jgi:hypothetical protein|nr:hypothetical protein [Bacteroidales bacterium]
MSKVLEALHLVQEMKKRNKERELSAVSYSEDKREYFRIASRRARAKNYEQMRAYHREYYRLHREEIRERQREYRRKRKESDQKSKK